MPDALYAMILIAFIVAACDIISICLQKIKE